MSGGEGEGAAVSRDALHALCLADPVWAERYQGWADLGRGGSAAVVRTLSRDAGAEIALKLFLGLSDEDRVRFQREVRNAQRLTSPCIVRTYSPFARGSLAWIEMELVDGPDLRQELSLRQREARVFAIGEATGIAAAVAQALAAAHQAGVVHRDVKPANVLLPKGGLPAAKLGDFGIARILGATRLTATGLMAGTPQFAAPEVVAGGEAGPPADVYGLALCLYLMLSGNRFPFALPEGAVPARWLRAHADEPPTPIGKLREDVPETLAGIVDDGLAKDPSRRPDVAEILSALGTPNAAAPVFSGRARQHAMRSSLLLAAGVSGMLLGGTLTWLGLGAGRGMPAPAGPAGEAAESPDAGAGAPRVEHDVAARAESRGGGEGRPSPVSAEVATPATRTRPTRENTPSPTVAPSASPTPEPAAPKLRASLDRGLLMLSNVSPQVISALRVAVTDAKGERHELAVSETLRPGEDMLLSLQAFSPRPEPGFAALRAEVLVRDETGSQRSIALPVGRTRESQP